MVPGQELALHTDVPEFRGVNRKLHPQWLLVAMRHSGLFEDWRMPIATGVAWFHDCDGGEFAFYPDGADGPPVYHKVAYNTALLVDTDSVFHGVDRVAPGDAVDLPALKPGMQLAFDGDAHWSVRDGDQAVAAYRWDELRFSISWKAYCFADEDERDGAEATVAVTATMEGLRLSVARRGGGWSLRVRVRRGRVRCWPWCSRPRRRGR